MGLPELIGMIASQGAFAILFVWLLYTTKTEGKEREDRLMNHLDKLTKALNGLNNNFSKVETRVGAIEEKLDMFEKK